MKKILFLITFLSLILSFAFGQSLDNLDKNNGFRNFKFGMSSEQFKNLTIYKSALTFKDVVDYEYYGGDISTVYGIETDGVVLSFYKNKLFTVMVRLGSLDNNYEDFEYKIMQQALIGNFGNDYSCKKSKNTLDCAIWDAKNVYLEHIRYHLTESDGTVNKNNTYGYLLIVYKPLELASQKNEF